MNKRIQRNLTAGVLALSLAATLIPAQNTAAAKAKLNRKKITLYIGNTFKLTTKSEHKKYYEKLVTNSRVFNLSNASLETLAIIAYNEPITRIKIG